MCGRNSNMKTKPETHQIASSILPTLQELQKEGSALYQDEQRLIDQKRSLEEKIHAGLVLKALFGPHEFGPLEPYFCAVHGDQNFSNRCRILVRLSGILPQNFEKETLSVVQDLEDIVSCISSLDEPEDDIVIFSILLIKWENEFVAGGSCTRPKVPTGVYNLSLSRDDVNKWIPREIKQVPTLTEFSGLFGPDLLSCEVSPGITFRNLILGTLRKRNPFPYHL